MAITRTTRALGVLLLLAAASVCSACTGDEPDHRLSAAELDEMAADTGLEIQLPRFVPETHQPVRPSLGTINDGYTVELVPLGEERPLTVFVLPAGSTPDGFGDEIDAVAVDPADGTDADVLVAGVDAPVAERIGASLTTSVEEVLYVAS
ncbi:MAG: hypothetical protein S0880_05670 [Actinomycetota bacterium]|nr:hypothetical protein [Actinomycetota bacterium]